MRVDLCRLTLGRAILLLVENILSLRPTGAETVFKRQLGISTAGQGSSNLISYEFPYP
jgi:hypothetical protein